MWLQPPSAMKTWRRAAGQGTLTFASLLLAGSIALGQAPIRPQQAALPPIHRGAFRAVSYDVNASISPVTQSLTAKTIIEFESRQSSRTVEFELNPNLKISSARDATGRQAQVERDESNPLLVRVTIAD